MQRIREFWNAFRNIAIVLSFVVNIITFIVLGVVVIIVFQITGGILEPLIDGLHDNFVAMNESTIIADVPVDDTININFTLPLDQQTNVVLAQDVVLPSVPAVFTIDGGAGTINGNVAITLPKDTILPVTLKLDVPVNQDIPIRLNVPVNIPLRNTELSVPFKNLEGLVDPYVRLLDNLPGEWDEAPQFALDAAGGDVDLLADTEGSIDPWERTPTVPGQVTNTSTGAGTATPSMSGTSSPFQATPTITPFPTLTPAAGQ